MTIKTAHTPWQPSFWVGGMGFTRPDKLWTIWMDKTAEALTSKTKENLEKDAAEMANSAIMRAMGK